MTLTRDRRTELLGAAPLFTGVDEAGLAMVAERAIEVDFAPGQVIARQGDVALPAQVWARESPYLWTAEGWVSLAVRLDWYARKGVGWAMRAHLAAPLGQEALRRARGRRQPSAGLRHHAERGCLYACQAYQRLLAHAGGRGSMESEGSMSRSCGG